MIIVGVVVGVLVLGAVLAWVVGRADVPGTPDAVTTQSSHGLAAGPLGPADVRALRFDQALRGYHMQQVDEALARLTEELAARDAEIDRLRSGGSGFSPTGTRTEGDEHDHRD